MQKHTRAKKKKKKNLNFSKHNTPCILTRRICAYRRRSSWGPALIWKAPTRTAPGSPEPAPGTTTGEEVGESLRRRPGSSPPRWAQGQALHSEGQVTRTECLQRPDTAFGLPTFRGGGDLPLSEGSACLHFSQKQPWPNPSAQRSAPFPSLKGGPEVSVP